jgi:hypothetical protein
VVALPIMAGPTNFGALGNALCSSWVWQNQASWMEFSVGRDDRGRLPRCCLAGGGILLISACELRGSA